MRTLVIHCHPDPASFSSALFAEACAALRGAGHELRTIELYAAGFDPILSYAERLAYTSDTASLISRVQPHVDALRWAEHLVFVYPVWFHGPPAMLKGWLERVWLPGVAFMPATRKGRKTTPGLRHIRRLSVVTTSGSPRWWLWLIGNPNRRLFGRALRALCARDCRLSWLQLHDMNNVTPADCKAFLSRVRKTFGVAA